jgi:DNA-directed RNA polymerase alpha subunit
MREGKMAPKVAGYLETAKRLVDSEEDLLPFQGRGLSERTIKALIQNGIDAPERFLFMNEPELFRLPGIGRTSLQEIVQ